MFQSQDVERNLTHSPPDMERRQVGKLNIISIKFRSWKKGGGREETMCWERNELRIKINKTTHTYSMDQGELKMMMMRP